MTTVKYAFVQVWLPVDGLRTGIETGRSAANESTHKVRLDANYYLGVFPVTQTQWALIQSTRPLPSCFQYEADKKWRPVENICYNEVRLSNSETTGSATYYWPNNPHANSFLGRLRTKTGISFDMPSGEDGKIVRTAGAIQRQGPDGMVHLPAESWSQHRCLQFATKSPSPLCGRCNIWYNASQAHLPFA